MQPDNIERWALYGLAATMLVKVFGIGSDCISDVVTKMIGLVKKVRELADELKKPLL